MENSTGFAFIQTQFQSETKRIFAPIQVQIRIYIRILSYQNRKLEKFGVFVIFFIFSQLHEGFKAPVLKSEYLSRRNIEKSFGRYLAFLVSPII
jgi:hypothetical protein